MRVEWVIRKEEKNVFTSNRQGEKSSSFYTTPCVVCCVCWHWVRGYVSGIFTTKSALPLCLLQLPSPRDNYFITLLYFSDGDLVQTSFSRFASQGLATRALLTFGDPVNRLPHLLRRTCFLPCVVWASPASCLLPAACWLSTTRKCLLVTVWRSVWQLGLDC